MESRGLREFLEIPYGELETLNLASIEYQRNWTPMAQVGNSIRSIQHSRGLITCPPHTRDSPAWDPHPRTCARYPAALKVS